MTGLLSAGLVLIGTGGCFIAVGYFLRRKRGPR